MDTPSSDLHTSEAPRGGAGIEICPRSAGPRVFRKPLVEGLVLKYCWSPERKRNSEAPRGGAGIEIIPMLRMIQASLKPLVEGLVLKYDVPDFKRLVCEAPRGGAGIEISLYILILIRAAEAEIQCRSREGSSPGSPSWRGWY